MGRTAQKYQAGAEKVEGGQHTHGEFQVCHSGGELRDLSLGGHKLLLCNGRGSGSTNATAMGSPYHTSHRAGFIGGHSRARGETVGQCPSRGTPGGQSTSPPTPTTNGGPPALLCHPTPLCTLLPRGHRVGCTPAGNVQCKGGHGVCTPALCAPKDGVVRLPRIVALKKGLEPLHVLQVVLVLATHEFFNVWWGGGKRGVKGGEG